jgi:hypothetical protein
MPSDSESFNNVRDESALVGVSPSSRRGVRFPAGVAEGRPVILVHNGRVNHQAMRKVQMTTHEQEASLRNEGCAGLE